MIQGSDGSPGFPGTPGIPVSCFSNVIKRIFIIFIICNNIMRYELDINPKYSKLIMKTITSPPCPLLTSKVIKKEAYRIVIIPSLLS